MVLINGLTIDEINAALIALQRSKTEVVGGVKHTTVQNISVNNTGGGSGADFTPQILQLQRKDQELQGGIDALDTRVTDLENTLSSLTDNEIDYLEWDERTRTLYVYTTDGEEYSVDLPSETVTLSVVNNNVLRFTMGVGETNAPQVVDVTLPFIRSAEKGVAGGVATLDASGRVPYSQLPESAMEFKGEWDASTNTPHLEDGTGTNGDFYIVSTGGTVNFGTQAEPRLITFYPNDRVLFDGNTEEWKRLPAGQVISVNGQSGVVVLDATNINYDSNTTVKQAIDSKADASDVVQSDWTETDSSDPAFIKNKIPIWITTGQADDNMSPIDSVTDGSMRPVTSNAVANHIPPNATNATNATNGVYGRLGGAKQASATNFTDLIAEITGASSGGGICGGSINTTATDKGLAAGWYNFLYIPHRNGIGGGDNYKYGTLLLSPMTSNSSYIYVINYVNGTVNNAQIYNNSSIRDSGNGTETTFAYSKAGLTGNPSWLAAWNGYELRAIAPSQITAGSASSAISASYSSKVVGTYTGSGGQQGPNYVGTNQVRFNMMNTTVLGDATYKDWLMMDCYNGFDVGGATALGISRQQLRAYIMRSNAGTSPNRPTSWAESGEIPIITAKSWGTASGYVKFSNGLIIQWINDLTISSTTRTGTLPLAFTSASSFSITCSVTARTGHRIVVDSGQTFSYQSESSNSYHMKVIAIGY